MSPIEAVPRERFRGAGKSSQPTMFRACRIESLRPAEIHQRNGIAPADPLVETGA
jgi:hypothetical protein